MDTEAVMLQNVHPGEVLLEDFLKPLHMSQYRLAKRLGVPQTQVSQIVRGKRSITASTAIRLSRFFGTTPEFWMNLQVMYDLEEAQDALASELEALQPLAPAAAS